MINRWMAGSGEPIGIKPAPNITPSRDGLFYEAHDEIGKYWKRSDWQLFLESGFRPDGSSVGGDMALVIQNTSALTKEDRQAIIEYMTSLKPMEGEGP